MHKRIFSLRPFALRRLPPSSAARHGILFSLHVELKHALRAGAHGMATLCAHKE